jgi:hypothetical protein
MVGQTQFLQVMLQQQLWRIGWSSMIARGLTNPQ